MYGTITNAISMTFIIIFFSIFLLVRVIRQKRYIHQRIEWRKFRKMTIQLLSISALFFFFSLPTVVISLAQVCGLPNGALGQFQLYLSFTRYFLPLLLPFVCLSSLPEVWTKLNRLIINRQHINTINVAPTLIPMRPARQA
jgi:phosphatidylglycerophosphate synthase